MKGDLAKVIATGVPSSPAEPVRLTQPPAQEPVKTIKPGSLMSQARDLAKILQEQEQMIAAAEVRLSGLATDSQDFTPPDQAALGIQLRKLMEHAAANCERLEELLKAL